MVTLIFLRGFYGYVWVDIFILSLPRVLADWVAMDGYQVIQIKHPGACIHVSFLWSLSLPIFCFLKKYLVTGSIGAGIVRTGTQAKSAPPDDPLRYKQQPQSKKSEMGTKIKEGLYDCATQ